MSEPSPISPPTDPDQLVAWSATPEGQEFFRRAGMRLMEARVNAEAAGRVAPNAVAVQAGEGAGGAPASGAGGGL